MDSREYESTNEMIEGYFMSLFKKILVQYERALVRAIQFFLLFFTFARWIRIAVNANFMDYNIYI